MSHIHNTDPTRQTTITNKVFNYKNIISQFLHLYICRFFEVVNAFNLSITSAFAIAPNRRNFYGLQQILDHESLRADRAL